MRAVALGAFVRPCGRGRVVFIGALLLIGCGSGPDLAEVVGRVTLDGAPLPMATVMFCPSEGGRPGMAMTDADGRYALRFNVTRMGAMIGRHQVKISTWRPADYSTDGEGNQKAVPERPERLPKRYHSESELSAEVAPGVAHYDFELQSK